jgi:hypothetical protein
MTKRPIFPKVGSIQIEADKSEWVIVGTSNSGVSRVRRNSLAHKVHAESSPVIALSYIKKEEDSSKNPK